MRSTPTLFTVFNDGVQGAGQLALVHVVLVLAHANALGVDLDQLGQRVLQAARDGTAPRSETSRSGNSWRRIRTPE